MRYKIDFVKREKAIHERTITDITIYSEDKALVRELAVRQYLNAFTITEDYASKILCFIYDKATRIEEEKSLSFRDSTHCTNPEIILSDCTENGQEIAGEEPHR